MDDLHNLIFEFEGLLRALGLKKTEKQTRAIRREARKVIQRAERFIREAQKQVDEMRVRVEAARKVQYGGKVRGRL